MLDAYIYGGLRSPFGRHGGALAPLRPDDLAAQVTRAVVARHGLAGAPVEDVLLGCTCQAGEDARNVAAYIASVAGMDDQSAIRPAPETPEVPADDRQEPAGTRVTTGGQ